MNVSLNDLRELLELAFALGAAWAYLRTRLNRLDARIQTVRKEQRRVRRLLYAHLHKEKGRASVDAAQ